MTTSPDKDTSAFAPTDQAAKPLQRWRVTPQVNQVLEAAFALSTYPNREQRLHLAYTLRATERNIQVWFQNRRQREKKGVGQGAPLNPFAHKLVTKRPLLDSHGKIEQGVVEPNRSNASPPPKRPEFEQRRAVSYDTAFLPTMRSSSHMNLFLDGEPQESTVNSAHDRPFAGLRGPAYNYASVRSMSVDMGGNTAVMYRNDSIFDQLDDLDAFEASIDELSSADTNSDRGESAPSATALPTASASAVGATLGLETTPLPIVEPVPPTSALVRPLGLVAHSSPSAYAGATTGAGADLAASPATGSTMLAQPMSTKVSNQPAAPPFAGLTQKPPYESHVAPSGGVTSIIDEPSVQMFATGAAPHAILWASHAWEELFGARLGGDGSPAQTLATIQGLLTAPAAIAAVAHALATGTAWTGALISSTPSGEPFSHTLRVEPLMDGHARLRCFHITSLNMTRLTAATAQQAATARAATTAAQEGLAAQSAAATTDVAASMSRAVSELRLHEVLDMFD